MCGIAGFTGQRTDGEEVLMAMSSLLTHRGPDEHGEYRSDEVSLAIRRLSIIDVTGGHQPYFSESRDVVAVFNGEIYGFASLRADLERRGHRFATEADGEVIVHGYEEWGDGFLDRIDGMFALAVWDSRRKRLLLARDRLGKKPLYVAEHRDGHVSFASELHALLQDARVRREVDPGAVWEYLRYGYVPSPRSAFEDVVKVAPGSALARGPEGIERFRYWTLDYEPKLSIGAAAAREELDSRVGDAVRARMISDVPLGAFLSGGIDSSLVVAHMVEASDRPVKTFSIGFADPRYDERPYAARVARALGTEHYEDVISADDLTSVLPRLVRQYGEPYADSSAVPTFYLARMAREHVTVALTGDGGDELLAGYERHAAARWAGSFDRLPAPLRNGAIRSGLAVMPPGTQEKSRRHKAHRLLRSLQLPSGERYADWSGNLTSEQRAVLAPNLSGSSPVGPAGVARHPLDRALAMDVAHYLPDDLLTKTDIATMASSLEARAPLLDYRLVEWTARLPVDLKQRRLKGKLLLREALARRLPSDLFERPKMGFAAPIGGWLRSELRELVTDTLFDPEARARGYVDPARAEKMVREHLDGGVDHSRAIWTLLMLELWHREVVDRRPSAASG